MPTTSYSGDAATGRSQSLITTTFNHWRETKTRTLAATAQSVQVEYSTAVPSAGTVSVELTELRMKARVIKDRVVRRVQFSLGGRAYDMMPNGDLQYGISKTTGVGVAAGSVSVATGLISIQDWAAGATNQPSAIGMIQVPPTDGLSSEDAAPSVFFRTASAPLRPGSVQIVGRMYDGTQINITSDLNGKFNTARVKGRVNYETGLVELFFCNTAITDPNAVRVDISVLNIPGVTVAPSDMARVATLRYNAVAYTYLPLDKNILGLDPVRTPSDGRVPVFKSGRVVVVHNTQSTAPATVSNGQTLNTTRTRLARVRVLGADGQAITTGWTADLDAGTVTFSNVAGYSQPVTIEHRIEDEALCAEAQITGDLRLTRPLTHDYPVPGTYVSSVLVAGTKQAAATEAFSQTAWTSTWDNIRIGTPITAQYNQTLHPIVVTNQGAIEERWALIFTNSTTFRVVGEASGEILVSSTGEACAPLNPATGVPYFTIPPGGWGTGWVAGNVLRFNTRAANWPLWVSRTVMQSPAAPPGTDQIVLSVRGDVDA